MLPKITNLTHAIPSHWLKASSNINFPLNSVSVFQNHYFIQPFSQNSVFFSMRAINTSPPSYCIWRREKKLKYSYYAFYEFIFRHNSPLFGSYTFLCTLLSTTVNLHSSSHARDHVLHPKRNKHNYCSLYCNLYVVWQ
jgi:hypothetical protein